MKYLLTILLCFVVSLSASAQTQQGYVKTRGRIVNGQHVHGQGLVGATVQIKGRNSVVVQNSNGSFSFPVNSKQFVIQSVKKNGYQLVDADAAPKTYTHSANPIYLVMDIPSQQMEDKLAAERKMRRTLSQQLLKRQDEIETLKEQNRITSEEYNKALQQLNEEQEKSLNLVSEMAERYTKMDFDQLDEFNRRVSDCIIEGRLIEADSLLNSRGNVEQLISDLNRHHEANIQARDNLEKSEAMEQQNREDIAQICYNKHVLHKLQYQNDSAAYYLELRVSLDTTNVEWLNDAGQFIDYYLANYSLALDYYKLGLNQAIAQYGAKSEWAARIYNNIGLIYQDLGDYANALVNYEKALDIWERVFGTQNPIIATSYNNIGSIYQDLEDYANALVFFQKALDIWERMFGTQQPNVATAYNNIGLIYQNQRELAKALEYHQNALTIRERVLGVNHPEVATSYNNIGFVYQDLGDYVNALVNFEKALDIWERMFGTQHPNVATAYNNIGSLFWEQGDCVKALEYFEKALDIRERTFGPEHHKTKNVKTKIDKVKELLAQ